MKVKGRAIENSERRRGGGRGFGRRFRRGRRRTRAMRMNRRNTINDRMERMKFNISLMTKTTKKIDFLSKRKGRGRRAGGAGVTGGSSGIGRTIDIVRTSGGSSIRVVYDIC